MPYSTKSHYCHEEIRNKRVFDKESFRSKIVGEHVIVFGCPKGQYNRRLKMCKVKPLVQKILHPKGEDKCPVSGVHFKNNPDFKYEKYLKHVMKHPYHIEAVAVGFILFHPYGDLLLKEVDSVVFTFTNVLTCIVSDFHGFLKELDRRNKLLIGFPLNLKLSKEYILQAVDILKGKTKEVHPTTVKMLKTFGK